MDFKQYPSYKDSGVEWLGGVPEHWSITPLKFAIKNWRNGKWGYDVVEASDDNLVCVRVADFDRQKGVINTEKLTLRNYKGERVSDCLLNENHILIERSGGGENQLVGATVKFSLNIKAVCSNFISLLEIKTNYFDLDFIQYYFDHLYSLNVNKLSIKQTSGIQNLDLKQYVQNHISFPEIFEQTQIVSFLDSETSRIDNLIAKQEKLIEKLEEHRKSVISHAVTKGLDQNIKMKDSGVEWLGEVPEHWEVTYLKYQTKKITSGKTPLGGATVYTDSGVIFLRSQNIYNDGIRLNEVSYIPDHIHQDMTGSEVFTNDILLNITGASIGRTCLVENDIGVANVNQHVCIIRPKFAYSAQWISMFLKSNAAQSQIFFYQNGAGREGLNFSQIGNIRLPLPSIEEQCRILDSIKAKNLKIDKLITKQKELIEKLKNYRTSIISHAVTGKIDVRDLAA